MGQQTFASLIADLPLLMVLLLFVVNVFCLFFLFSDRRRAKAGMTEQVELRVREEMERLTEDTRRINDDARQLLASISLDKAATLEENGRFRQEMEAAKSEIQRIVSEIQSVRQYVTKITTEPRDEPRERDPQAPAPREQPAAQRQPPPPPRATAADRRDPPLPAREPPARAQDDWNSPEALLAMARQAGEWAKAAGYLARLDPANATSKNLEAAGDICRDQGFLAKAIEFYREATAKDPENCTARAEFLAISAKAHASEREESLRLLQELISVTLSDPARGPAVQNIYFTVMTDLGRQREVAAFCEAQLLLPLPRTALIALHRYLAGLYKAQSRTDEAIVHCDAALRLTGDDLDLLVLQSQLLFAAKNYEEAYRVALRALQHDPTTARSYISLATIQEKRMGRPAARELLNKAVQWASPAEAHQIEEHLRRMAALDDLSEIVPSTGPQLIRA